MTIADVTADAAIAETIASIMSRLRWGLTSKVTGDRGAGEAPPVGVRVDREVSRHPRNLLGRLETRTRQRVRCLLKRRLAFNLQQEVWMRQSRHNHRRARGIVAAGEI